MDQIVKYSDVSTVNDVVKKFASLPVIPVQDEATGAVKFTIADFPSFLGMLTKITSEYHDEIIINEKNVSAYEKDAAAINKLIKFIKDGARDFVNEFTYELYGVTRGKNKVKGQVQICEELLKTVYDKIHSKTTAYRDEVKKINTVVKTVDEAVEAEQAEPYETYKVSVPKSQVAELMKFVNEKGGIITKEEL